MLGGSIALMACALFVGLADEPRQATDVRAEFRAGQTFLTWRQAGGEGTRYRIYRSTRPITAAGDLTAEHLIAEVHDHTSLNLNASIDRIALSNTRAPAEYQIPQRVYFVIKQGEPPLSADTGLFVHTAQADETAYYAVTAVTVDQERHELIAGMDGNTLAAAVAERAEFPQAVLQNADGDYTHWSSNVDTKLYPAMSSLPSMPYNFRVRQPSGAGPHPLTGILHGALLQYNKVGMNFGADNRAVRIALDSPILRGRIAGFPNEAAPMAGWYGYNSHYGTGKPLSEGNVVNYTVRRVLWTLSWAEQAFKIDPDKVALRGGSMGGGGCLTIGVLHPERFAAIHGFIPYLPAESRRASGQPSLSLAKYIAEHPDADLPYMMSTVGRTDNIVGWKNKLELAQSAQDARIGFSLYWDLRDHSQTYAGATPAGFQGPAVFWGRQGGQPEMSLTSFSRKQSFPAIYGLTANSDPGTVDLAVRADRRPSLESPGVGDLVGAINAWVNWDRESIVDQTDRWEISMQLVDYSPNKSATGQVTPRRLQRFKPAAGERFSFRVTDAGGNRTLTAGEVTVDQAGRITVDKVPFTTEICRLFISKVQAQSNDPVAADGKSPAGVWPDPKLLEGLAARRTTWNFRESEVPEYQLPDPLQVGSAGRVTSAEEWERSGRPATLELFRQHVYGRSPQKMAVRFENIREDNQAMEGKAQLRQVRIVCEHAGKSFSFDASLLIPKSAKAKVPAFVLINHRPITSADPTRSARDGFWPAEEIIARGYAAAVFQATQVDPDDKSNAPGTNGVRDVFPGPGTAGKDAWGTLAAWAWGASRVLDYLETVPEVDAAKVAVVGHSRGGKTALWAGAEDQRFALVNSNDSGCGGAALSRRQFGETVGVINRAFPHWFCDNFKAYSEHEDQLPVDQHQLLALIAPRALCVASAEEDFWADQRGEFLSLVHAAPVYALFGNAGVSAGEMPGLDRPVVRGRTAYHIRRGVHNLTPYDWNRYMDFAGQLWGN